jgi:hypothetical protein
MDLLLLFKNRLAIRPKWRTFAPQKTAIGCLAAPVTGAKHFWLKD